MGMNSEWYRVGRQSLSSLLAEMEGFFCMLITFVNYNWNHEGEEGYLCEMPKNTLEVISCHRSQA